jgi:pilus assembly protein CpaE
VTGTELTVEQPRVGQLPRGFGDVAVVASTPDFEMRVRRALSAGRGPRMVRWQANAGDRPESGNIAVCFIGPDLATDDMISLAQEIDRDEPGCYLALVSDPTPGLFERALRAGVRDVVTPRAELEEISVILARGLDLAAKRKPTAPPVTIAEPPKPQLPEDGKRVIVMIAPKGGVGKTFVSSNLACLLGSVARTEVAYLDLDLQFGDVATSLHLNPEHSTVDAARAVINGENQMMKVFLIPHDSGIYSLAAPDDPADSDDISYEHSAAIARQLNHNFRYVIVDTAAGLDSHTLAVAEIATDFVFVCSVDVASVRGLRKVLDAFDRIGMHNAQRHLVINRSDAPGGARPEDVETALGLKAGLVLPFDRAVLTSMNQGSPIAYSDPKSPIARKFMTFAEAFAEMPSSVPAAPKSGLGLPWRKK